MCIRDSSGIKRYRSVLYQVGKEQFPNPPTVSGTETYQEHQELLETLGVEIEALGKRLASTACNDSDLGDRWERHQITATHHLGDPQSPVPDSELKLFLAKRIRVMAKMFNDPDKDEIEWKLVDWTNPVDRGRTGEYEGTGKTDYEAVREALRRWSNYYPLRIGNRYPKGSVSYIVPAGVCSKDEIRETFQTNGST